MKYSFSILLVACLSGCVAFPINSQDESKALGKGNFRLGATTTLNNPEISVSAGVAKSTDIYGQIQTSLYSAGIKQTLIETPGKHGLALLGGGFVSEEFSIRDSDDSDNTERKTGAFIGGTGNWYQHNTVIALQLQHNFINTPEPLDSQGLDFEIFEEFQKVTQLTLTARWRRQKNKFSLKGGVSCLFGFDQLPVRAEDQELSRDVDDTICLPVVGFGYYID